MWGAARRAAAPGDGVDAELAAFEEPVVGKPPSRISEIEARVNEYLRSTYAAGSAGDDELPESVREEDRVSIKVYPDGRVVMLGPENKVTDIEDTIDIFESDLGVGEVIRIFEFTYGDVSAAARILEMMFNEPRTVWLPTVNCFASALTSNSPAPTMQHLPQQRANRSLPRAPIGCGGDGVGHARRRSFEVAELG